ncbi:MAG: DUF1552 domain-containing protein [Planctomycetaceae bacterium]|nr:DUF1552 domain-containing protein [Planctomycetaceae bacterium]
MSFHRPINRRTMLRGVGAAVCLPLLDVMGSQSAMGAAKVEKPVRLCYLYFPNGVAHGAWKPEKVESDGTLATLNRWMKPLEPFKSDIVIPRRIWTPRGNGHGAGTATWLTGHGYDGRKINAGGASADQIAARATGSKMLLPSLELSTRGEGFFSNSLVRNTISWSNQSTPVPRETEPRVVFDRMFRVGDSALSGQSVLDAILADARSLRHRISTDDHRKLDEYLESVRAVERRIQFADRQAQRAAENPELTQRWVRPNAGIPQDYQEYMRLMLDMITLAYWADATRVSSFMLDHGQSNRYFNFVDGVQGTWHALSHWKDASGDTEDDDGITSWGSPEVKRDQYNLVTEWHHRQIAYFLGRLKQIKEADGSSLLDNSAIVYGSSLADGHEHSAKNLPVLVAGGGGGSIRSGREIRFRRDTSMSKLHLSLLRMVDPEIERFGETQDAMTELNG